MTYGVTDAGFTRPRLIDIKGEIQDRIRSTLGANVNLLPQSVFGQLIGILSEREDLVWQAMEDCYNSAYPDLASGVSLDNAAALTGVVRKGAQGSVMQGQLFFGAQGTLIPKGSQLAVQGSPTSLFATTADITLAAGQNCVQTLTPTAAPTSGSFYLTLAGSLAGPFPYNVSAATLQAALQALPFGSGIQVTGSLGGDFEITFAGASGLQEQAALIVSQNTLATTSDAVGLAVTIVTAGVNQGSSDAVAVNTGPIVAPAGQLTSVVTPVNGWTRTINKTDAIVGRDIETDNAFKQRRRLELQIAGDATLPAIRSKILAVTGVRNVLPFENDSFVVDSAGRPPKCIEIVVQGGADQDVWNELYSVKAGGIQTYGNTCGVVTDDQGQVHPTCFSRPTLVPIYIRLLLTINPTFPANGVATIKQELAAFGNALGIGREVVVTPYLISAIANIPGIETAVLLIDRAPNPTTSNNVEIAAGEVATFDTSRITVVTS